MFVPDPVVSLAIKPVGRESPNFSRALQRFQKEDPTFKVHMDKESKEVCLTIYVISNCSLCHRPSFRVWVNFT